ncbi:hypothetical protein [Nocardia xishanensis]|uniref:hypothetical protein n=1 Tax=Nocardia xishanensis TaxID=238964 RepID=UPI0034284A4D
MSNSVEDPAGIAQWLKNTGYPLEMRVGSIFRRQTNLFCQHGSSYADPITGTIRTTDIRAGQGIRPSLIDRGQEFELFVDFYIECKARPAPWIIFVDRLNNVARGVDSFSPELTFWYNPHTIDDEDLSDYLDFVNRDGDIREASKLLDPRELVGYEICEKRKEDRSNLDPAFAAVRQAASAAIALTCSRPTDDGDQTPNVGFPVLVTGGLLFEAWMDENENLQVAQVDRSRVMVTIGSNFGPTLVHVVTESGIEEFARDCAVTAAVLVGRKLDQI